MRLHAFHGCLEEEAVIGGNYIVDVKISTDFSDAEKTDKLKNTVDYVTVFNIVKKEMAIRSKLIEHVAGRIASGLMNEVPGIDQVEVSVTKLNPPMNGDVDRVTVVSVQSR